MVDEAVKEAIQTSYSQFLKTKSLSPRYGQKLMIAAIARALAPIQLNDEGERKGAPAICVVEAGTGTGKTVAYLLAALPIAKALGKKLVISTATIALQEQIVFKDLPDVKKHSGLNFEYGLVKGRGRYLCLSKLDRLLGDGGVDDYQMFLDEGPLISAQDRQLYQSMMNALASQRWEGDKDAWPQELPQATWARVTTDHRQCSGRRCSFVRQCAFFRARDSLEEMDVIVANHDLVLADLALGGGAILPAPADAIFVFDEGHHLPEKAVSHFAAHTRVVSTSRWLGMIEGQWKSLMAPMTDALYFTQLAAPIETSLKQARLLMDAVQPQLAPYIVEMDRQAQTPRYRFPQGQVTPLLESAAAQLDKAFIELSLYFEKLSQELGKLMEADARPVPLEVLESLYPLLGGWLSRAEANAALWASFAETTPKAKWPVARWITLVQFEETVDFELVSSPILASQHLNEHLWQKACGVVATSATLTALGSFDRFRLQAGTPDDAIYQQVPSPFDFAQKGLLRVPKQAIEGNLAEAHTQSLIQQFPSLISPSQGTLVLFASRKQMMEVYEGLEASQREAILIQGQESKHLLLQKHKQAIDHGRGSVLFGLASFAEGVDLPGRYCEHVIIAKIPFAVPDDPVEAAMAEWIDAQGGNAFMQIAVPDAAIKLVQACGRLLRTEEDAGQVTVMDKRLVTKQYGKAILKSLPPFKLDFS